jgi:hypothetical protein
MNKTFYGKLCRYSVICLALTIMMFQFPGISRGAEYTMEVDVSPNIINIASERYGEIRIWTNLRYSTYIGNSSYATIFFNESDSVENIRATSDSLGNLILKFSIEDLLALNDDLPVLLIQADNEVKVIVGIGEDTFTGYGSVYIVGKKASDRTFTR